MYHFSKYLCVGSVTIMKAELFSDIQETLTQIISALNEFESRSATRIVLLIP